MARHVGFMLKLQEKGAITFDYGNNLREFAKQGGEPNAFNFPGFTPAYIRPCLRRKGPVPLGSIIRRPRRYLHHRPRPDGRVPRK